MCARLRPSNIDASACSVKELARIVSQIRQRWPDVKIIIRGDSDFCREHIMLWCECNNVDYVLGLAKNGRLKREIAVEIGQAKKIYQETGQPGREWVKSHRRF